MKRLIILMLLLLAQWIGFGLLEAPVPDTAVDIALFFASWFGDALLRGGAVIAAALAVAAVMRVRGVDASVLAIAAAAAVLMSRFPAGDAFWWTALPAAAGLVAFAVTVNAAGLARLPAPFLLLTLISLAAWRGIAFTLHDADAAPPFLLMPGYDALGYTDGLVKVLGGLFVLGAVLLSVGRRGTMLNRLLAWTLAAIAILAAAFLETARSGEASPMMLAGYAMHAVAAAVIAGAAVGAAPLAVAAVLLAGLNVALFAEAVYGLSARFGTLGGIDIHYLQFPILAVAALAAAWFWRRRKTPPQPETTQS